MTDEAIDDAILSILVEGHWQKVAKVILKVRDKMGKDHDEESYELIARRIKRLVNERHLVAQGDIQEWRHSEVRRPG
ncbi:MAG: hypothetical protein JST77_00770 [Acidobacteria bacterium]|nr:hypothetical protein [Acidobacteriota bacterium]